ncbi:hypothetical protein [Streptomyces afghaniensis]|uniref:hypothetical protein n=1 Tax=Streptomyces afghaniensis TaxID=66865 RepID=UPI00277FCD58|nr:hypothetical protein [Streptomyces afghaniensis]MDQ1022104.1 hypothetical protein [Streptomyces afghaniensis]
MRISVIVPSSQEPAAGTAPSTGVATGRAVPDAGQGVVWVLLTTPLARGATALAVRLPRQAREHADR